MARGDTKERILSESLRLFAVRGYDGVTVRDIAGAVGIRQSSLYKHFAGKQAIFRALVEQMRAYAPQVSVPAGALESPEIWTDSGGGLLRRLSTEVFQFYRDDPAAARFRKLLTIERYRDPDMARIYREVCLDAPLARLTALFARLTDRGVLRQADPEVMALQFFSPIFLLLEQADSEGEREDKALECLARHVEQFDQLYRAEGRP